MSFNGSSGSSGSIHASTDVALSNPASNQVLSYNTNLQKWQNGVDPAVAVASEASTRANGDSAHIAATDPHGDRAYADSLIASGNVAAFGELNAPQMVSLWYRPLLTTSSQSVVAVQNRLYLAPGYSSGITISQLDCYVVTGAAGAIIRLGLYLAPSNPFTNGAAWTLITEAVTTIDASLPTTRTTVNLSPTQAIAAGRFFAVAGVAQGGAPTIIAGSGQTGPWSPLGYAVSSSASSIAAPANIAFAVDNVTGALPSSVSLTTASVQSVDGGIGYRRSA